MSSLLSAHKSPIFQCIFPFSIISGATSSSTGAGTELENGCPRYRIVIRRHKRKAFSFHMKDEQEKVEWLSALGDVCGKYSPGQEASEAVAGGGRESSGSQSGASQNRNMSVKYVSDKS